MKANPIIWKLRQAKSGSIFVQGYSPEPENFKVIAQWHRIQNFQMSGSEVKRSFLCWGRLNLVSWGRVLLGPFPPLGWEVYWWGRTNLHLWDPPWQSKKRNPRKVLSGGQSKFSLCSRCAIFIFTFVETIIRNISTTKSSCTQKSGSFSWWSRTPRWENQTTWKWGWSPAAASQRKGEGKVEALTGPAGVGHLEGSPLNC